MAAGRLSWEPEGDSGRRLETSELIRVYGELKPLAQPKDQKKAHADTAHGTPDTALILAELKALREEMAELRQAMRLIEYKPEMVLNDTHDTHDTAESVPNVEPIAWWKRPFLRK